MQRDRDWKQVKDEHGIKVFQRPVRGSEYDEYRLETIVDATLSALVAVNSDIDYLPRWMEAMEGNRLVSGDERRYVSHTTTKVPWPAKNRDAVVETRITQNSDNLQVTMEFSAVDNLVPVSRDYERVKRLNGFWIFTPQDRNRTHVIYQNHAEAGGKIPGWIANMFGVDVPFKSVRSMMHELQGARYKNVRKEFIRDFGS